jgi:hypothetical protein
MHVRKDFAELARRTHDEALVGVGPRNEVLNALVFEHAVRASVTACLVAAQGLLTCTVCG